MVVTMTKISSLSPDKKNYETERLAYTKFKGIYFWDILGVMFTVHAADNTIHNTMLLNKTITFLATNYCPEL